MDVPWEITLAVLGLVVPVIAALYEFAFNGRKRLGYRVQMDTTATDLVHSQYTGALQQLRLGDGSRPLVNPSFVLLRVENNGVTDIDTSDYARPDHDRVGITAEFPGRTVAGIVVTEVSADFLMDSFGADSGLGYTDGVISLPRVPMNRGAHYKVLAALEAAEVTGGGRQEGFEAPRIHGGIKGGVGSGAIQETRSRTGTGRATVAMVLFLTAVIISQLVVSLNKDDSAAPLDCARGTVTLLGSTAFEPVLRDAYRAYQKTCPDAHFVLRSDTSAVGVNELDKQGAKKGVGRTPVIAFSDGPKANGHPRAVPRPVALLLFTVVANKNAGVSDLTQAQIRQLYAGKITDWSQVGGKPGKVRLVSRDSGSGSRRAFEQRVLGGAQDPGENSDDCRTLTNPDMPQVVRCRRDSTDDLLDQVASTPGAIGFSELGSATRRTDVDLVGISGQKATLAAADAGAYPFWATEYAYTYGDPVPDSLVAGFLRYVTDEVGRDIVRHHGDRPCQDLSNAVLCGPSPAALAVPRAAAADGELPAVSDGSR
ncbi:PstS family phosphate ABC transporter substrate-binding protein [Streptomyces sp. NPDC088725]|uniref:PstS family phosphate ABC transporter substrate-binding protein n=1 Tax=Streptomyces sp. NPDC088725 TaxID=3365873 RepID=UPI00382FA013